MRALDIAHFASLMLTALCLGPAAAHLLELPAKIDLPRDAYLAAQQLYRGWALLGIVVIGGLVATAVLAVLLRHRRRALRWVLIALACLAGAQIVFWTFTYPANVATAQWTALPPDWETLRARWEYSHAAGAAFTVAAMAALIASALARTRSTSD